MRILFYYYSLPSNFKLFNLQILHNCLFVEVRISRNAAWVGDRR